MKNQVNILTERSLEVNYEKTGDVLKDVQRIIDSSQKSAYHAVNLILLRRNWLIGKRIAEEALEGNDRAGYGAEIISSLSTKLTAQYGKGYTKTNLYYFVSFYEYYPEIFHSVSGKSSLLSWTHYRVLLQVHDDAARDWYENEAARQGSGCWSDGYVCQNV